MARENRNACAGLFVFSQKTAPSGRDALFRDGDDVFVVWDADKIESDVILRAGLCAAAVTQPVSNSEDCLRKKMKNISVLSI